MDKILALAGAAIDLFPTNNLNLNFGDTENDGEGDGMADVTVILTLDNGKELRLGPINTPFADAGELLKKGRELIGK